MHRHRVELVLRAAEPANHRAAAPAVARLLALLPDSWAGQLGHLHTTPQRGALILLDAPAEPATIVEAARAAVADPALRGWTLVRATVLSS